MYSNINESKKLAKTRFHIVELLHVLKNELNEEVNYD